MAFKLRSGNTTPFKQMGSSSAKPKKGLDEVKNGEGKLKKEMISKPVEKKKHFLDKINPVTKIKKFREPPKNNNCISLLNIIYYIFCIFISSVL